jgi:uncharacterized protein YjbI with pentapeptide repeats
MREPSEVVINGKALDKIIEDHQHWLRKDCTGWKNMRADLSFADLHSVDLSNANLPFAILRSASLLYADISRANLQSANLSNANLQYTAAQHTNLQSANLFRTDCRYSDLSFADLQNANLAHASLRAVNLSYADLTCANLLGAEARFAVLYSTHLQNTDMRSVNLKNADVRYANLQSANLEDADVWLANLYSTNLQDVQGLYVPYACPETGSFIGWKKAGEYIVCLKIPVDARRVSATSRKCRCDKAKTLGIYTSTHKLTGVREVSSDRDIDFVYRVGETVYADKFNPDRWNECAAGIHFFTNFQEAVNYGA